MDEQLVDKQSGKKALRTTLRADRRAVYGEDPGRRSREAEAILAHAAGVVADIEALAARREEAGDPAPRVAAFHPTPTEADRKSVV